MIVLLKETDFRNLKCLNYKFNIYWAADFTDEEIEEAVEKKIEILHQFDLGYTLFHFKEGIPVVEGNTYTIDQVAYIRDASKEEYDASPHVTIVGCNGEIITSKEEARNSCAAERKISF